MQGVLKRLGDPTHFPKALGRVTAAALKTIEKGRPQAVRIGVQSMKRRAEPQHELMLQRLDALLQQCDHNSGPLADLAKAYWGKVSQPELKAFRSSVEASLYPRPIPSRALACSRWCVRSSSASHWSPCAGKPWLRDARGSGCARALLTSALPPPPPLRLHPPLFPSHA